MEKLDVVDENNEVIGKENRNYIHKNGLPHRSVMFFVINENQKVLVTKRSKEKDFFPGYWSIVLGGHVESGETYEDSLKREMEEEINTIGVYEKIGNFVKKIKEETEYVYLYKVFVKGSKIKLSDVEFIKGEFWTLKKIKKEMKERDFLPETDIVIEYL